MAAKYDIFRASAMTDLLAKSALVPLSDWLAAGHAAPDPMELISIRDTFFVKGEGRPTGRPAPPPTDKPTQ